MDTRCWTGTGPEYGLEWAGRAWTLRLDADRPGLYAEGAGPVLALAGIAARGRWAPLALTGTTLTGHERRFRRVEANFAPPDWHDLIVRASWWPIDRGGVELEVEVKTFSVGQLGRVEVAVVSDPLGTFPSSPQTIYVTPRDADAAGLSYDGREPGMAGMVTLPPDPSALVTKVSPASPGGLSYAELVPPGDAARRLRLRSAEAPNWQATRYGLFGYDLERGVVLRARLRGFWLAPDTAEAEAAERLDQFLAEPPPLST